MTEPAIRLVNGVFQGGGAKGIAYAGALQAMEERRLWFGSVAGTSAGSIIASVIAAGLRANDVAEKVSGALAATKSPIAPRFAKLAVGHAHSVFESDRLRTHLDGIYRAAIGSTSGAPVTFAELHAKTKIELYVLAVDLSNGLPTVFNRRMTPDAEVAAAVAASAAIPGAFPAARAVFDSEQSGATVHQLVDGSLWANYPSFIFDDHSFRCWLHDETKHLGAWTEADEQAWDVESARPLVGFVVSREKPPADRNAIGFVPLAGPDINRRFDRGPTYTSGNRVSYLIGAVLSSDWARLLIALALVAWIANSIVTLPVGFRRFATVLDGWMPDWLFPVALVTTMAAVVLATITSIALIAGLILVSRMVADTVLPSVDAVVGVPMSPPPWVGTGDDSVVIRVPRGELSTLDFDVDETTRAAAVDHARASAGRQLDDPSSVRKLDALFAGRPDERPERPRPDPALEPTSHDDRISIRSVLSMIIATSLLGVLAWWATNAAGVDSIGSIMLALAVAVVVGVAALIFLGGAAGSRAATRARVGVTTTSQRPIGVAVAWIVTGVALVVASGALSAWTMAEQNDTTFQAEVVKAERVEATDGDDDLNVYELRVEGSGEPLTLETERHLRLGEEAFVEIDEAAETASIVGALDDPRFAVAIVLCLLGLFVLTAGVRTYNYIIRCRRLGTLVAEWQQDR